MNSGALFDLAPIPAPAATMNLNGRRRPPRIHPAKHLESRAARGVQATWCRICQAPLLTGLDNDRLAFDTRVDAQPIDAIGEMLAWLSTPPRRTYTLDRIGHAPQLTRRTAYAMSWRPAGPRDGSITWDIHAEHRCHQPLPACASNLPEILVTQESDVCPY